MIISLTSPRQALTHERLTALERVRRFSVRVLLVLFLIASPWAAAPARAAWPEIGPDDVRLSATGADSDADFVAAQPRVAYNPQAQEYLVVWAAVTQRNPSSRTEIFAQRVSALTGQRVGGVIAVSVPDNGDEGYLSEMPDVVYNGVDGRYFVVWHRNQTGMPFLIFGRFINAVTSEPLGAAHLTLVNWGSHNANNIFDEDRLRVAYSPAASRYWLVWASTPNTMAATVSRVQGIAVASDGRIVFPQVDFTGPLGLGQPTAADTSPSVVYNPEADEFLVTWLGLEYWYVFDRHDAAVFAQRVTASSSAVVGAPLIVSRDEHTKMPPRAMYPDVAYVPGGGYLLAWVGTAPFGNGLGTIQLRWLPGDLENRLPTVFSALPETTACVGTQPALAFVPGEGRGLVTWSSGDGSQMGGSLCPGGAQIFGLPVSVGQQAFSDTPVQLSQMGPVGGTSYRAFRPAVAAAPAPRRALTVWYGNDELPGVAAAKQEVFGQLADLSLRVLVPALQNGDRPPFSTSEVEPNNTSVDANGPVVSGMMITGFANDVSDYYRLTVTAAGTLSAAITNPQGQGTQLQLYREPVSTATLVQSDGVAPYAFTVSVTPGVYFVRVYTAGGHTSAAPYSLQVTFP